MQTKEGAQAYAEQVLNNLERDIEQIHRIVRNGQDYLAQQKNKAKVLPSDFNNSKAYAEQ